MKLKGFPYGLTKRITTPYHHTIKSVNLIHSYTKIRTCKEKTLSFKTAGLKVQKHNKSEFLNL